MTTPYVEPGVYRHYKGKHYQVLGTAKHTEEDLYMVIYLDLENGTAYARPFDTFYAKVEQEVDGELVPRFVKGDPLEGLQLSDIDTNIDSPK